jgi:hypothetical protein
MMTLILMWALQSEGSSTMVTRRNADTYRLPADLASDAGDVALTHFKSTAEVFHKFDPRNFLQVGGPGEIFGYDGSGRLIGLPEDPEALRLSAAYIHFFRRTLAGSRLRVELLPLRGADAAEGGTYAGAVGAGYQSGPQTISCG